MGAAISVAGRRVPRPVAIGAAVAVAVLVAAALGGRPGREGPPLDPRSDAPLGTSALVALLRELGADVSLSPGLPDAGDDVALVLEDRLDEDQAESVLAWVEDGGTLVVPDPRSPFTPAVLDAGGASDDGSLRRQDCTITALDDVQELEAGTPQRYAVVEGAPICFGTAGESAFVVTRRHGLGELVAVGGAAVFTNELLDEADNAVLAAALLAPMGGTDVRFIEAPAPAGGGSTTLVDLVGSGVKRALLQLAVAFVLYALWRAIRLGRPVAEDQPVEIAGSELVNAVGRMLARTRAPAAAADTLRSELRRALRTRYGVLPSASAETLAAVVAARSGLDPERILAAVDDRPVTTDDQLVDLARAVSSIHQEVLL